MKTVDRKAFLLLVVLGSACYCLSSPGNNVRTEGSVGAEASEQTVPDADGWYSSANAPAVRVRQGLVRDALRSSKVSAVPRRSWATSGERKRSYDVAAAVRHLDDHAAAGSLGQCAAYVRRALQAGGLDVSRHPRFAKNWGPYLLEGGFKQVRLEEYALLVGDVVVIQPFTGGSPAGHIAMYDGTQWVSDFRQLDLWGGPGYRKHKPTIQVYRP